MVVDAVPVFSKPYKAGASQVCIHFVDGAHCILKPTLDENSASQSIAILFVHSYLFVSHSTLLRIPRYFTFVCHVVQLVTMAVSFFSAFTL